MNLPPPIPEPSSSPPPRRRWWRLTLIAVSFGLAIGLIGAYVNIPYYTLGPGPAKDVEELVRVSGRRAYPSSGGFYLTTVSVSTRPVSLFEALVGWVDPAVSVVPRRALIRPGFTDEQQSQYNALEMEESKYSALLAALRGMGINAPPIAGARVIGVAGGFPAEGKLKAGDLIVVVNGRAVRDPAAAVNAITSKPIGSTIAVEIFRGDRRMRVQMRTIASPLRDERRTPVVGVRLAPAVRLPFDITIDSQNIGGPSAGLAFALTIIDVLTPEDLSRGHTIAVTGTIGADGNVGDVGGVEFKVAAAEREGADVFLVPANEVELAKGAASKAKIIGVATLTQALAALRSLPKVAPNPR